MEKKKLIYRYIILSASYLFLTALFFAAGYSIGYRSGGALSEQVSAMVAASPAASEAADEMRRYRVILEDGELRLYSDENGISRLISAENISESPFPARDIAILKEGVSFEDQNDAFALMENFLS